MKVNPKLAPEKESLDLGQRPVFLPQNQTKSRTEEKSNEKPANQVVRFVDEAIEVAWLQGCSDIHFESHRTGLVLKFRQDGVMQAGGQLAGVQEAAEVISRIKVMAQLDITERRKPQDGRIHWAVRSLDIRVSVMPSLFGEDVVLRLLDKSQLLRQSDEQLSLQSLGFVGRQMLTIRALASRPHGMLLITGPTGSGKTTTAYAALSEVNDGLEKIVTIEDPVEYELPGTLQIPVNEKKGLTFATGLRSILRHDPDKILVGEIRDAETAQIAIQSALTGHLVFTTVHANSLTDVLGRFQHLGIDPFALASALNGVIVQRLLRQLCKVCIDWRGLTFEEMEWTNAQGVTLDKVPCAVGCPECQGRGYAGRFVVAQVHVLDPALRDAIVTRQSISAIDALLKINNETDLKLQAISKVQEGKTTLSEIARVIGYD
jgi:general secretion pathway protein E